MIKFKEPTVPVRPFWCNIRDIYYITNNAFDYEITIWAWLERDYGAHRLSPYNDLGLLRFKEESELTAFLLKFA